MAAADRDRAMFDARRAADGFRVLAEQQGPRPGTITQDPDGRQFWVPGTGPSAGQMVAVPPDGNIAAVRQVAAGPPPNRQAMLAALAGRTG